MLFGCRCILSQHCGQGSVPLFVEPRGLSLSRPPVNGGTARGSCGLTLEKTSGTPRSEIDTLHECESSVAGDDAPCCRRVSRREVLLAQGELDVEDGYLNTLKNS